MAEPSEKKKSPRELLGIAFRHPILFFVGAALFAFAVLVYAHFRPLEYTGTTVFERRSDAADTARGKGGADSYATYKLSLMHDLKGEKAVEAVVEELGLTRGLPRNSEGGLTPAGKVAKQGLIKKIRDDTDVKWEVKSDFLDLVSVSVTDRDPKLAQQIPNELVKSYIEDVHGKLQANLAASLDFLKKQTGTCQSRLTELDANRLAFETEHAPLPLDNPARLVERIETAEARLADLQGQKQTAEVRLWAAEKRFQQLARSFPGHVRALALGPTSQPAGEATTRPTTMPGAELPDTSPGPSAVPRQGGEPSAKPPAVAQTQPATQPSTQPASPADAPLYYVKSPNPEYKRLEGQLREEKDRLDQAKIFAGMKETHPTVKALLAKIGRLEELIQETPREIDLPVHRAGPPTTPGSPRANPNADLLAVTALTDARTNWELAKREVEDLSRAAEPLVKRLKELQALEANFAPKVQQYREMNEEIKNEQAELARWQKRMMEVQTALSAEVAKKRTHLKAIQAAQEQLKPSSPKLLYVLGFAIGGGLAFGAGLVFLANMFDRTISTPEDAAEHFELPVLGVIGEIITNRQRMLRKLRRKVFTPAVAFVMLALVAVAAFSILLRLEYPDFYGQWTSDPVAFVWTKAQEIAGEVSALFS